MEDNFYTQKGYELNCHEDLTASMEDYLEMICRMLLEKDVVRIQELSSWLHVKPSSASKMVGTLKEKGYIQFEKYGYLTATAKGREAQLSALPPRSAAPLPLPFERHGK